MTWYSPVRARRLWFVFLPLVALTLPGCGNSFQPVRGELFYQGQPAVGAVVVFHPVGDSSPSALRPSGKVGEDGSFTLTSVKAGDGAPPGDYVVTISWPVDKPTGGGIKGMGGSEDKSVAKDRLGDKYLTVQSSTLRRTVNKGNGQIERIDLK